jgi:hypothetical protein
MINMSLIFSVFELLDWGAIRRNLLVVLALDSMFALMSSLPLAS